ncbi:copper homeostasis periplasmic binding protein CopC [Phenylobacterium sp.]|uniref:copper homeostasis periplasmic binding protein CopC n=1 Tax=Phenylobacterium sp. TaxID=1871053 RepID=UPI002CF3896E|nr:copper homeostasis periplasmic binding protein CopC [Phenylobacterium sp.]HLZ75585.1 copper homeostasis periplasmic binding protein CopC [Phenylobacterium sp.]
MRNAIIVTAAVAALAIAGQASAHARLLSGTPKNGATVAAPKAMTLKYSEELVPAASNVKVATAAGAAVATGPMALDKTKKIVTVPFTGPLAAGGYTVTWHMKTEDGHETDGAFAFKVK